jgi:hypothetical protein
VPHDTRDAVVDYLTDWAEKTELPMAKLPKWADVPKPKFYEWRQRYGKANEHNGKVPRDHWLDPAERKAILDFHDKNPLIGYRRLTFMMLDQDIVAASPATVYRVRMSHLHRHEQRFKSVTGLMQNLRSANCTMSSRSASQARSHICWS